MVADEVTAAWIHPAEVTAAAARVVDVAVAIADCLQQYEAVHVLL